MSLHLYCDGTDTTGRPCQRHSHHATIESLVKDGWTETEHGALCPTCSPKSPLPSGAPTVAEPRTRKELWWSSMLTPSASPIGPGIRLGGTVEQQLTAVTKTCDALFAALYDLTAALDLRERTSLLGHPLHLITATCGKHEKIAIVKAILDRYEIELKKC
jgi:hypothetical protein